MMDGQEKSVDGHGQERGQDGWTWTDPVLSMDNAGHAKFLEFRFVIRIGVVWASGMMLRRDAAVIPLHDTSGIAKVVGSLRIACKYDIVCFETI